MMAGAILGGALISGVGGAVAADKAASAQADAAAQGAQAQRDAAAESARVQREMFDKSVELQEPFRQAGISSLNQLRTLLGMDGGDTGSADFGMSNRRFSMADFNADPGYGFRMSEGMKALENSAAARGGLFSGSTMKGINRFGQDLASTEYQNAFNRYQAERTARLNPLQSMAGMGQTTAATLGNSASNLGSNLGANQMQLGQGLAQSYGNMGQARASGYVGMGNALTGAVNQGIENMMVSRYLGGRGAPTGYQSYFG